MSFDNKQHPGGGVNRRRYMFAHPNHAENSPDGNHAYALPHHRDYGLSSDVSDEFEYYHNVYKRSQ